MNGYRFELDDLNPGSTYVYQVDGKSGERLPFAAAFDVDAAGLLRDLLNAFGDRFEYRGVPGSGEWVLKSEPTRALLCRARSRRWTTYGTTCHSPLNADGTCPDAREHIDDVPANPFGPKSGASRHGDVTQSAHVDAPGAIVVQSGGDAVYDGRRHGARTPITGSPRSGDVNS